MKSRSAFQRIRARAIVSGFSLVELLAVMAIMTIMMAMLAPAMKSFSDTAGRRGAVTTLMNTLEQARVAALESGREVYVVFVRRPTPDEDELIVLRDTESGAGNYEQLTKWIKLPRNVLFFEPASGKSVLKSGVGSLDLATRKPLNFPSVPAAFASKRPLAAIIFNGSGQVSAPNLAADMLIHISEGARDLDGNEARVAQKESGNLPFEIISLSKYTGRSQLDITQLAQN